jgi:hypothetical protein
VEPFHCPHHTHYVCDAVGLSHSQHTHSGSCDAAAGTLEEEDDGDEDHVDLGLWGSMAGLLVVALIVSFFSNLVVTSIDGMSDAYGMSKTFVGVILLPLVGNATEHMTAGEGKRREGGKEGGQAGWFGWRDRTCVCCTMSNEVHPLVSQKPLEMRISAQKEHFMRALGARTDAFLGKEKHHAPNARGMLTS